MPPEDNYENEEIIEEDWKSILEEDEETEDGGNDTDEQSEEETSEDQKPDIGQLKKLSAINKRLKKKLEKLESQAQSDYNIEDVLLEAKGIEDEQDVSFIKKYAKATGMTVSQALKDDFVKDKLAFNEKTRKSEEALGRPKGKTSQKQTIDGLLKSYLKDGKLPADKRLAEKVIEARLSQETDNGKFFDD